MRILLNNIKECFNKILKHSDFGKTCISIIVSLDVDAICALRILTSLLNREHLPFKMIPVSGYLEMSEAIASCGSNYQSIIFLNCGNLYDMSEYLQEGVRFFIFDSHQPIHHGNVNKKKIFIIDDGMAQLDKCPFDDAYDISDSEIEDESADEQSGSESDKKSQIQNKQQKKIRKEQRKHKMLINQMHEDYYNFGTYHSRPTATIIYSLAQQLNHDCNDHLWYAILGLTDAYIHLRTNQKNYEIIFNELQNEVIRLNIHLENTQSHQNPEEITIENSNKRIGVIFIENEYKFLLLRQQSLYKAMYYSSYVGTKLKLWKDRDCKRLEEFIVRLGIPLCEAKQQYKYMNQKYKIHLKTKIAEVANKFQMDDVLYRSFVRQADSKLQISAADMVNAITAILEYPSALLNKQILQYQCSTVVEKLKTVEYAQKFQNFWCALDTLDLKQIDLFDQGVDMALEFQEALVDEATSLIEKKEIVPTAHFRYAILGNETTQQKKFFQHPQSLQKLAMLLMEIYKENYYKSSNKSVVLVNQIKESDLFIIVGVVGVMGFGSQEKNQFGNYFLRVVNEQQLQYRQDSFETSVIEVHKDDFPSFLNEIMNFKKN